MASSSSSARQPLPDSLRDFLKPLLEQSREARQPLYLVGDCVRELLLGHTPVDLDLVVEGSADRLVRAAGKAYKAKVSKDAQRLSHTLRLPKGRRVEITTAHTETFPETAMLPVVEPASLQEDLYRRDFSMNAMALSLNEEDFGHVWDPFGGAEDLRSAKVRVLHAGSFKDDPARVFRAARFAVRYSAELEWRTREWLAESIQQQLPSKLSGTRLRDALMPLLNEEDPRPTLRVLADWNALDFFVTGLSWGKTHETLFGHVLKSKTDEALLLRVLALVHAISIPKATGALSHMMFPQPLISQVEAALRALSEPSAGSLGKNVSPALRGFLSAARRAKSSKSTKKTPAKWQQSLHETSPCLSDQDFCQLGYKPSPRFKKMVAAIREARWEGKLRTREEEVRFLLRSFPLKQAH